MDSVAPRLHMDQCTIVNMQHDSVCQGNGQNDTEQELVCSIDDLAEPGTSIWWVQVYEIGFYDSIR